MDGKGRGFSPDSGPGAGGRLVECFPVSDSSLTTGPSIHRFSRIPPGLTPRPERGPHGPARSDRPHSSIR